MGAKSRNWQLAVIGLLAAFTISRPVIACGHGGVTPEGVMIDMKHKGTGPFASPMFRNQNGLAQDWLGITGEDYQEGGASGVRVTGIRAEGPADSAGIKAGDVITAVSGKPVKSKTDLDDAMSQIKTSGDVEFSILHNGKPDSATVYVKVSLGDIDPKLSGVMRGETQPNPQMMRDSMQGTMISQTPVANAKADANGKQRGPGMFMEDMMGKAPIAQAKPTDRETPSGGSENLLENYFHKRLSELQKSSGDSEKDRATLQKLDLEYKKFVIANNAAVQLAQIDLEQALSSKEPDLDKAADAVQRINKLNQERAQKILDLMKQLPR